MDLKYAFLILFSLSMITGWCQLSPGDLAQPHAHLEGMSNCTKCHTLGAKISNDKCLACHTEIKVRVDQKKGYHSSSQVYKKSCTICHSDHHGRQYQIIRFDKSKFDHKTTGYTLEGKHASAECSDCHKSENITDPSVKKKKSTYLGLNRECLSCHEDYHQKTLSANCSSCHNYNSFKPAAKFDHSKTKFILKGKHQDVTCEKCHEKTTLNGKEFQKFKGLKFKGCVDCHKDVHNNSFGQQCENCHVEQSFKTIKSLSQFNHDLTNFKLEGKHSLVTCNKCHKGSYTDPLKHDNCYDCHSDYHNGEFTRQSLRRDCSSCHNVNGFSPSLYTIDDHNKGVFKLEGAHIATPCIACHKNNDNWKFSNLGTKCSDCHEDIHQGSINEKYYPGGNCLSCHSLESWNKIVFDHDKTNFPLRGKHGSQSCRSCHGKVAEVHLLNFSGLNVDCESCHEDQHNGQFISENKTVCSNCHTPEGWNASSFNHDNARFVLDGRHKNVSCDKCHPLVTSVDKQYVLYKTGKIKCADCH